MTPKTRARASATSSSGKKATADGGCCRRVTLVVLSVSVGFLACIFALIASEGGGGMIRLGVAGPPAVTTVSLMRVHSPEELDTLLPISKYRHVLLRVYDGETGDDLSHPVNRAFITLAKEVWHRQTPDNDDALHWSNTLFAEFDAGQHPVFAITEAGLQGPLPIVVHVVNGKSVNRVEHVPDGAAGVQTIRDMAEATELILPATIGG